MADVTVLIPCYNAGPYLSSALKSVFRQTYPHWNIIILDDASTDNSLQRANAYLEDPRVRVLRNNVNLGQSNTQNIGLAAVDTPYIAQLDADDWFMPDTLQTLVAEIKKLPPDTAVLYGNFFYIYQDSKGNVIRKTSEKGRTFRDAYDFLRYNRTVRPRFFRTQCLLDVGGWPIDDPYEGRYAEDRRILLRLIERYRFHWIDKPLYNYRRHPGNKTNDKRKSREALEWLIRDTLVRWGNQYKPIFELDSDNLKRLKGLAPNH